MLQNRSRSIRPVGILLVAGGIAACTGAPANSASDDFARDLQLASTAVDLAGPGVDSALLGRLETQPKAAPQPAARVVRGSGERAVVSRTPTVRATPAMEVAAVDEGEETESLDEAPVPEETMEPVAVAPRPTGPVVVQTGGAGDYGTGGGGIFGGGRSGGGIGVVIRGGGVDGDNCELHRGGRRGTTRGPIYLPRPVASNPTMPTTPAADGGRSPTIGIGGARGMGTRRPSVPSVSPGSGVPRDDIRTPRRRSGRIGG